MKLRENQIEPVRIGIEFFKQKNTKPSILLEPCAFGKSLVISKIAHEINEKMLVLQPSAELLEQNLEKLRLLGGSAEVFSASLGQKNIGDLTYATIGSIKALGGLFKGYKLTIDECDRYPRKGDSMLGKFLKDSGITQILGFTATPLKLQAYGSGFGYNYSMLKILTSRSKFGNLFKEIIHVTQIKEMVELGYWSPLIYQEYEFNDSLLVFNTTKAEYTDESVEQAYKANNITDHIIEKIRNLSDRKSILIFAPSVAEAKALAAKIPGAEAVWGDMDKKERKRVITGFKELTIRIIVNVNVLSIGFDHPQLDCIIGGRATASLSWFYQAMARGVRIHPEKQNCLIIDYVGNIKKFGRLEDLYYKKEDQWKLYGADGKLLTGIPIHEIGSITEQSEKERLLEKHNADNPKMTFGKHKGVRIKDLPKSYANWLKADKSFTWNKYNKNIKTALDKL